MALPFVISLHPSTEFNACAFIHPYNGDPNRHEIFTQIKTGLHTSSKYKWKPKLKTQNELTQFRPDPTGE